MKQPPAPPPWRLTVPTGGKPETAGRVRDSINALGLYRLTGAPPTWSVEPGDDPPPYLVQLGWRLTAKGLLGRGEALWNHLTTRPSPTLNSAMAQKALVDLRRRTKPQTPSISPTPSVSHASPLGWRIIRPYLKSRRRWEDGPWIGTLLGN